MNKDNKKKSKFTVTDKRASGPDVYKTDGAKEQRYKIALPGKEARIPPAPDYKNIGLKILDKRVLFQNFPKLDMVGSIFLPNVGDVAVEMARVVAVGELVDNCKVGDIIYKIGQQGQTLLTNVGEFQFLPQTAIIAIIDENNAVLIPPIKDDAA